MISAARRMESEPRNLQAGSGRLKADEAYSFAPGMIMVSNPTGAATEAIRALRTHLTAQHVQEGRRAIAICAASRGVGCSFVAANLAVAFSQAGLKTLLVDADMRDPTVEEMIRPPRPRSGLVQYLASADRDFSDSIAADVLPGLSIIYSGGAAANAQELLAGERFKRLMDFCMRDFDITVLDTPAANTCADARRVSTVVGYSLIVARRNKSFVDDVKTLSSQLHADHARVVGTVLNEA
jgi:protein-tyrosine kinase